MRNTTTRLALITLALLLTPHTRADAPPPAPPRPQTPLPGKTPTRPPPPPPPPPRPPQPPPRRQDPHRLGRRPPPLVRQGRRHPRRDRQRRQEGLLQHLPHPQGPDLRRLRPPPLLPLQRLQQLRRPVPLR